MGEILEWLSVVGLSTVKVLAGLGMAITYGMKPWEIFVALAAGSMIGVLFFTFFGQRFRAWRKERRKQRYVLELHEIGKARNLIARRLRFWQSKTVMFFPGFIRKPIQSMIGSIYLRYRRWLRKRRRKSRMPVALNYRKARKWKRMWLKFGLPGIALLTPPLISPPIGALIAVIFERRKARIMVYMSVSILLWSALFALVGDQILALIHG